MPSAPEANFIVRLWSGLLVGENHHPKGSVVTAADLDGNVDYFAVHKWITPCDSELAFNDELAAEATPTDVLPPGVKPTPSKAAKASKS